MASSSTFTVGRIIPENSTDVPIYSTAGGTKVPYDRVERILEAFVLSVIMVMALFGNISIWIIIIRDRSLRNPSNALVLCLSTADILVSAVNMPVTIFTIVNGDWAWSQGFCVLIGYTNMITFIASVMSLGVISLNRYVLVCHPHKFKIIYTWKRVSWMIAGTWLLSMSLGAPALFGWGVYDYLPNASICFCDWATSVSYTFFMVGTCFGGPCSVMTFSYINILREVRASRRRIAAKEKEHVSPEKKPPSLVTPSDSDNKRSNLLSVLHQVPHKQEQTDEYAKRRAEKKRKKRQEDIKLATSFLVVIITFIVCWLPYCITMFASVFSPYPVPRGADMTTLILGFFNSCCNPVIYGLLNNKFRAGFIALYCTSCNKRTKVNQGSLSLTEITPTNCMEPTYRHSASTYRTEKY